MGTPTDTNTRHDYDAAMLAYARESRDAAVKTSKSTTFTAWVVGIFAVLSLIGMLVGAVQIVKLANAVTSPVPSTSSDCATQGGYDYTC